MVLAAFNNVYVTGYVGLLPILLITSNLHTIGQGGTYVDTLAASDVTASSSCAGKRPCRVVLVASCLRRSQAPRQDKSVVQVPDRSLPCTTALLFLPARRYASAVTSHRPVSVCLSLSVSVCLSVCHKSQFYQNG